jgi:KipI family sensor histidine kinase inhibitor
VRLRAVGDRGIQVELDDAARVAGWASQARKADVPGVVDVIPGATTVTLWLAAARFQAPAAEKLAALEPSSRGSSEADEVLEVPVRYDGPDLEAVAASVGLDVEGVVAAHTGTLWHVAFTGFAPGFGYLASPDGRLTLPRRDDPRARVPAGSVSLAAGYCGIYPSPSPGGWHLIGRSSVKTWDLDRDPPAMLRAGVRVQFVQVT